MPNPPQPATQPPEQPPVALANLKQWFDQAGQILGKPVTRDKNKKKKTLEDRNQKVFDRLQKLQDEAASDPSLKGRLDELTRKYQEITTLAQGGQADYSAAVKELAKAEKALKESKRKTPARTNAERAKKAAQTNKDKALAQVVDANKKLRILKSSAALEVAVASGDNKVAKKKAASIARHSANQEDGKAARNLVLKVEYENLKLKADEALATLKEIPRADTSQFDNLLTRADKLAGNSKYDEAIVQLKTYTTVFGSAKKAATSDAKSRQASEKYEQLAEKVRSAISELEAMGVEPGALEDLYYEAERLSQLVQYEKASKKLGGYQKVFDKLMAATKAGGVKGSYEYNQLRLKTQVQIQELDANPDAHSKPLKTILDGAVADAKPDTPEGYSNAIKKLATHDTEYKKAVALAKLFTQYKKDKQSTLDAIAQLKLIPLADASELEDGIAVSEQHEGNSLYQLAIDKYVGAKAVQKMVTAAKDEAKKKQKEELKQLAAQPKYQGKLIELETFFAKYGKVPYFESIASDVETTLRSAKDKASADDYVTALAALEDQLKEKEKFLKEYRKNREKVLKDPEVGESRDALKASLDKLTVLAEPSEYAVALKEGQIAMNWALKNPSSKNPEGIRQKYKIAVAEMGAAKIKVDTRLDELRAIKSECEDLSATVVNYLLSLKALLPTDELAKLQGRSDRYSAAIAAKRYEEAVEPLTALRDDVIAVKKETQDQLLKWTQERAKVIKKDLDALGKCPATLTINIDLNSELSKADKLANDNKSYTQAIATVETLPGLITKATETVAAYDSLKVARKEAEDAVKGKVAEIEASLKDLETMINARLKAEGADPEAAPAGDIRNNLSFAQSDLRTRLNTAISKPELELPGMLKPLEDIADQIAEAGTNKALDNLVSGEDGQGGKKAAQLRKKFDSEQRKGRNLLSELGNYGGSELNLLEKQHADLAGKASDLGADLAALANDAADLGNLVAATLAAVKHEVESTQAALNTAAAALRKKVDNLEKKVKQAILKPAFDGLRQEVTDLDAMSTSNSLDSLSIAQLELDKLDVRFTELENKFGSGAEGGLDEVIVMIKAIDSQLNASGTLSTCKPSHLAKLKEEYKTAHADALKLKPAEAVKELKEFQAKITVAEDAARQVLAKRKCFDESYKLADTAFKALLKQDSKSAYLKTLGGKLSAVKTQSVTEDEEDAAIRALEKLQTEINNASDPDVMMTKEKEAREARLKAEQDALKWDKTLKVFKANDLVVAGKAVKSTPEGDMKLLDELKRMVSAAEGAAKGKDYVEAHRQLELTRTRAATITLNPQGEKMTSRNNLMGDNVRWRKSVTSWNKAWTNFRAVLAKEAKDAENPDDPTFRAALKTVDKLLNNLTFRYDLNAFQVLLTALSNPKTPVKEGLKAREAALRMVRQYQTALLKSPSRSDLIDTNPFDGVRAEAKQSERDLLYALESLQGNVQRAVG